jgi:hypothetical protein
MMKFSSRRAGKSKKRLVYTMAALATMIVFLPFRGDPWATYVGAWGGYTILVFGLRWANRPAASSVQNPKSASAVILTHLTFLAIAAGWVKLCIVLIPYLPYFLLTEDTNRPYFGLSFLGILGLMLLEAVEQRYLRPEPEADGLRSANQPLG